MATSLPLAMNGRLTVVLAAAGMAVIGLAIGHQATGWALGAAAVVGLLGPTAYSIETVANASGGAIPTAGPMVAGARMGPGGRPGGNFPGGNFPGGQLPGGQLPGGMPPGGLPPLDGQGGVSYTGTTTGSATVTGGLIETFSFPGPGTYTFSDSLTGIPMTVTVK